MVSVPPTPLPTNDVDVYFETSADDNEHARFQKAKEQLERSMYYAFRDRKQKKRDFRSLWIVRINAACRMNEISYSKFMHGLKLANVELDRKVLADMAMNDLNAFNKVVAIAKDALK